MEFWLSDGDCPLPGTGDRSAPDTPKKPSDGWADFTDAWGGLLAGPQTSLRQLSLTPLSVPRNLRKMLLAFDVVIMSLQQGRELQRAMTEQVQKALRLHAGRWHMSRLQRNSQRRS